MPPKLKQGLSAAQFSWGSGLRVSQPPPGSNQGEVPVKVAVIGALDSGCGTSMFTVLGGFSVDGNI